MASTLTSLSLAVSAPAGLSLSSASVRETTRVLASSLRPLKSSFVGDKGKLPSFGGRRAASSASPMLKRMFGASAEASAALAGKSSLYDFTVKDIDGKETSLEEYKGKVALVVNVASQCGLTQSNYSELTSIYDKYKDKGFVVLAFPSNQFGGQEPGSNQQIKDFACSRFKAQFPLFDKIDVNGPNAAPVYQWLKSQKGELLGSDIKWNFGKFLVDKTGKVVNRYAPTTGPKAIEKDIEKLLAA